MIKSEGIKMGRIRFSAVWKQQENERKLQLLMDKVTNKPYKSLNGLSQMSMC